MHQLRPLSLGEILDGALAIFRSNFITLVSIAIICQGIPAVMNTYVTLAGGLLEQPIIGIVAVVLGAFGGLLAAGAIVHVISEAYLGHEETVGDALHFALSKIWQLFIAGLVKYLLLSIGFIFFVVPGIIIACGYAVVAQVVVLEELRAPTDALSRSWQLTKGFKGKAFGLGLVVFVMIYIPIMVVGVFTVMIPAAQTILVAGAQLVSLVIYPVIACAFTLLYYDLRVRKEAFDLEHLSRQLGLETERFEG